MITDKSEPSKDYQFRLLISLALTLIALSWAGYFLLNNKEYLGANIFFVFQIIVILIQFSCITEVER